MATVKGFRAWLNTMPGSDPTLHVVGIVEVPTGGWAGTLTAAVPPGINPAILILDARLIAPTGTVIEVVSNLELRFQKTPSPRYRSVTIRGLGDDFDVPVEVVS